MWELSAFASVTSLSQHVDMSVLLQTSNIQTSTEYIQQPHQSMGPSHPVYTCNIQHRQLTWKTQHASNSSHLPPTPCKPVRCVQHCAVCLGKTHHTLRVSWCLQQDNLAVLGQSPGLPAVYVQWKIWQRLECNILYTGQKGSQAPSWSQSTLGMSLLQLSATQPHPSMRSAPELVHKPGGGALCVSHSVSPDSPCLTHSCALQPPSPVLCCLSKDAKQGHSSCVFGKQACPSC